MAAMLAVALAIWTGALLNVSLWDSFLVGLISTPLAPIAKDVSSALVAAGNAVASLKR